MHTLAPAQRKAVDALIDVAAPGHVVTLVAAPGMGKTRMLRAAQERLGGRILTAGELQGATAGRHPLAIEDAFHDLIEDALRESTPLFVDDADLVARVVEGCHMYPRGGYLHLVLTSLANRAAESGRTIVMAASHLTQSVALTSEHVSLDEFDADDYRAICAEYLSPLEIASIDFAKVHRFARRLNARQLRRACQGIRRRLGDAPGESATEAVIDYLRSAQLVSNVDLGEVQSVRLEDLRGLDDVLRALEANVILPLEHGDLANELSLKPKRGVLLAGPPGTGKTTIGRALAHRLRGKFFLVDGTVIAGTPMFYQQLHHVFEAAMRNAPAVVFIDDSDVIFEGQDPGLYRYLLTMLDGLESESAGGVCLMMTAMDVGSLPPALVRSGRIELWLETRLPDETARRALLGDLCRALPLRPSEFELEELARTAEGLSGADLKRLVEDGKVLYAFDRAHGHPTRSMYEYFNESLATVRANKERYAAAEASARMRNPTRPPYFNSGGVAAAMMMRHTARAATAAAGVASFAESFAVEEGGA
jgi:transitional endoplasmic reticulum ATPase